MAPHPLLSQPQECWKEKILNIGVWKMFGKVLHSFYFRQYQNTIHLLPQHAQPGLYMGRAGRTPHPIKNVFFYLCIYKSIKFSTKFFLRRWLWILSAYSMFLVKEIKMKLDKKYVLQRNLISISFPTFIQPNNILR